MEVEFASNGLAQCYEQSSRAVRQWGEAVARKYIARINELYAAHTGQTTEKIEQDIDRDRFMSAEEAVEYGIIDKVIQHKTETDGKKTS